ncbi:LPD23 domain-containing protein [uncultured Mitsuokella sp.]|uniref:LPD23 domain-containing protein n=1 Tax=uncultured Mitsuokella sp. TaxID=453120 RepID=UPI002670B69A|nr:LPD23 domain-containing protein [uncultured Mitsuokella sp.]
MAFDRSGYKEYIDTLNQKNEAPEEPPKEEKKSFFETLGDVVIGQSQQQLDYATGASEAASEMATGVVNTAEDVVQAAQEAHQKWQDFRQRGVELQQAYSPENVEQANDTGDYSNMDTAVQNAQEAGEEFTTASRNLALSPVRQTARSFIDAYADDNNGGIFQEGAQALQRTDANLEYFMTDSEKLAKARQIEASTGIPAEAFIADNKAYKQALDIYNFKQKVDQVGGSIENVWNEFPELRDVADMDPEGAAIALHNLNEIRSTHGILETFTKMYERGSKQLEFNNLQYKIMMGRADDNDIERANRLKEELQQKRQEAPSFFDNPVAAIVGGVAESLPEMGQSMLEGAHDAIEYAALAAIAGAMAGSAAGPLGAGGGALVGGTGSVLTGFARSLAGQAARRQLVINALRRGAQVGAFTGMAKPESGSRYDDLGELRDKDGNPLLTDNQIRGWTALAGGGLNAGIEMMNFGMITKALSGAPHAKKVFGDILENTGARLTRRESILNGTKEILNGMKENAGDILKITASEAGEEGLQSISDDMIHNGIEWATGDTSNHVYSAGEILGRAAGSSIQAIPGSLGFGLMGAVSGTGTGFLRQHTALRNLAKYEAQYGENARKTYIGTIMLEQLQQAVRSGKLKEQAPEVQKKILREELKHTDYPTVHVDTEMALEKENGLEDLKALAKAANISDEELKIAIEEKGQIMVPTEQFAQADTSEEFLQSVSFSPEADSMARMQHDAKTIIEDMKERQQKAIDKQVELINTILDEYFPLHDKSTAEQSALRDMATAVIYTNPANPARGWSAAMQERKARLQEILAPALKRLRDGMGKGGQTMEVEDEQGNKRTQRFTENDEWYRNFYKLFKRKPTEAELEDMAVAMTTGDASAPKIEGWIPTTEEEHQAMAALKPEIDQLRTEIHHLKEIKGTMKSLNGVEMELTQGLSKEGFQVYRAIRDQLSKVDVDGGRTARAARMDAILFARHADIVADIITKKTGKKYTALDYMRERYGLSTEFQNGKTFYQASMYRSPAKTFKELYTSQENYPQMAGTNARTAGIMALQKAQAMQNAGRNAQEIWKETGWLQGRDGRWRFEIPDHLDKIDLSILQDGKMHTVGEIYENPELFQAYPALQDIRVQMDDSGTLEARDAAASAGYDFADGAQKILFNPKDFRADDKQAKMTLVHEIQHVIQSIEGFAKGGNANTRALIEPQMQRKLFDLGQEINGIDGGRRYVNAKEEVSRQMLFGNMESDAYKKAEQEYQEASAALSKEDRAHLDELAGRIQKLQRQMGLSDTEFYRHLAGEQEASMTAARAENPTKEMPVPHTKDAIILYGGGVVDALRPNDIKGSISQMSNGQRIISLFEHADESTFLHEMSHMFLLDLEDLAKLDDISAKELQIVQDWASWKKGDAKAYKDSPWAKEFAKREEDIIDAEMHGDDAEAAKLKRQWMQEKFARAFELYLRDGKAPAKGLKAVFRKFRSFLIHIYRAIIGDEVKASVPVQRVMDRMIATEDEIEAAALDDRYRDVTKAGGEKLLNESEEDTYKRWQNDALAEAKEELMKRVMKDLTEKKEKEFQERMAHEEEEFRENLQNENVYLAERAMMESGGNMDIVLNWYPSIEAFQEELKKTPPLEKVLAEHMEAYRKELDQQLIDSYLSESAVSAAMDSSESRAKLEELTMVAFAKKEALMHRITEKTRQAMRSIEEKLTDIPDDMDLKMEKDNPAIKELLRAINRLRFSAKWTEKDYETIERMIHAATKEDVKRAVHDFKERMSKEKKKSHDDKANEDAVRHAAEDKMSLYKKLAERAILRKPLHEACSPYLYEREAKKWAKEVEKAIRGKRWDTAMMAQQNKAMAMAMADEARKMQERVQKLLDKVKKQLQAKSVRLPKEERYWHRHLAYLLRITQTDAKHPEGKMPTLEEIFKSLKKSLDTTYIPTEIFEVEKAGEDFKGYRDLNIGQFEECVEALTILYTTGRDTFKMKTIGGRQIGDIVQEIVSESDTEASRMGVNRKRVEKDTGGMGWNDVIAKLPLFGEGLARYGQQGLAALIKPEEVLSALGKKAHDYIYGIYEKAAEKESRMVQDEMVSLKKILAPYSHAEKLAWKDAKYELWTADGKERLTKENIICMALNFGNEVNRQRLVGGLGMEERDVRSFLEKNMMAKDWQLVQDIWNHIDSYWDDTAKVEESLNGVILEKVQALPFTVVTKDKNGKEFQMKLKGGYYPIAYDPEKSSQAADQSANEVARQSMSGAMVLGTHRGFVKARSEHDIQDRPLLLKFQVIPDHVQSVIHNIAFRLAARDVFRLVNHPAFVDYVSRSLGREYHTILKQWTTDVWQVVKDNNNQAESMVKRGINWLRGNSTMAIMGYRLWPAIENISNIAPVMDQLGALHGLKAVVSFYGNLSESWKMLQRSVFMRDRINSLDRDIRQQPGLFAADHRAFEIIRNHAYDMMLWSDLALSAPLWVQTYKDVYGDKLKEIRAENEAHQQAVLSAQDRVKKLKADVIEQTRKVSNINMELEYRHSDNEEHRNYAKQSPFAVHSDAEMRDMAKAEGAKIQEIKQELFKAQQEFQDASELTIYTDEEILRETERRSVMAADKAIRDTFGSGRTMDQSSLQRNRTALLRLATTFYSFFNTQFNAILAHYRHARFSGEPSFIGRWAPFARSMMYRLILMSLIGISIKFALGVDGNDDKDKYRTVINPETGKSEKVEIPWGQRFFNTYANNLLSTAAGGFPFFRDVVNMALAYFFDGTTYGRSVSPFSVGVRAFDEGWKAVTMLAGMSEKNMAMDEKEEARKKREADELKKKKGKARIEYQKKLEKDEKYRQPVKHITYSEVARHAANSLSSLTAARTGITSTIVDAITGTMQYLNDTDGRYDKTWNSMVWSALFDKKPVEREIPKRPPKEPAKKKTKKKKKN